MSQNSGTLNRLKNLTKPLDAASWCFLKWIFSNNMTRDYESFFNLDDEARRIRCLDDVSIADYSNNVLGMEEAEMLNKILEIQSKLLAERQKGKPEEPACK